MDKPTKCIQAYINNEWIDVTDKCRSYGSMASKTMEYALDHKVKTRLVKVTVLVEYGKQYEQAITKTD